MSAQSPKRCSCRAVACGDPGVSCDMGRRPLVRRRWHRGSPFPARQGMRPPAPRPPRSPRQSRLRSRTLSPCPVVPRESSDGLAKPPPCRVRMLYAACQKAAHPCRFAPAAFRPRGASVPTGCISPCDPRYSRIGIAWHLGVGSHKLWLPRQRRISACRPVSRSVGVASDHAAIGRLQRWLQNSTGTKAAPSPRV